MSAKDAGVDALMVLCSSGEMCVGSDETSVMAIRHGSGWQRALTVSSPRFAQMQQTAEWELGAFPLCTQISDFQPPAFARRSTGQLRHRPAFARG